MVSSYLPYAHTVHLHTYTIKVCRPLGPMSEPQDKRVHYRLPTHVPVAVGSKDKEKRHILRNEKYERPKLIIKGKVKRERDIG